MYYPRFTKAIIHYFITKDKSISMRNIMFMHTTQDDSILGPMRFVSKADDFQVYRALLPEVITNQKMRNSPAYKTYLAYATGAATPKKAKKFKKPASPSKKRTLVTIEEEEPEPAKKVVLTKKSSRKQSTSVQIRDTPIEEAQVKKVLKRSRRETTIHQAGGSGDGTGSKLGVPDEPKGKSVDTNEETCLKLGVLDVSKVESSKSKYDSWGDSGDEANVQGDDEDTNDDEEESDNECVHTPEYYVPTDDEANNETKDVYDEEYERISEELYGDVNVRLTYAKHNDEEKGDADMIDAAHVQSQLLQQQPLLPFFHHAFLLFNNQHQSQPTTTEATTSTIVVPESETLSSTHQRITDLENDVKELKNVDNTTTVISTIKSEVPNDVKEYLELSFDDAIYKVIQKHSVDIIKEHFVPDEIVERLN
ncbi:hypothetical protein Tco_0683995 [Tanacetum coccineum]